MLKTKRVYDESAKTDGFRVLVDRLWPRGLSKDKAKIALWLKDIAPSDTLRKRFCHDPKKWSEFKKRYFQELDNKQELVSLIVEKARKDTVTLLYGARDVEHNNALVLKAYLEERLPADR